MSKKPDIKTTNAKRRELLDFAHEYGLIIHPGSGFDYYIDSFFKFGRCPCDAKRKNCPCPEAVEECRTIGHCKCHLYWKDNATFKEQKIAKE